LFKAARIIEEGDRLRLAGPVGRVDVAALSRLVARRKIGEGAELVVNLAEVEALDSAAVAWLVRTWRELGARGAHLYIEDPSPVAARSLQMFRVGVAADPPPPPDHLILSLGGGLYGAIEAVKSFFTLAADASVAILVAIWKFRRTRWSHLFDQCVLIGSQALPIVGLVSLLVGLTLAFQSAYQLQQFGAAIYVADLTGVAVIREMGPLITAILVAGRSGSSIAAEIGTMQVAEEVDALRVMGIDPLRFLAVPRLLAIVLMVPLLTTLADVMGVLGGFVVGIFYLDIAWNAFAIQMLKALAPFDLVTGLFKSLAFAYGIGLIGLYYGFSVRGGAGEVGRTTTASVVAALFYIIVADSVFSVLFYIVL
jgi:phospholipid/cholesterol/gamma-HCH transport system permease protein